MIEHPWTGAFHRAHKLVSNDLDRRALTICEAWLIWADPFDVRPDANLIDKFETCDGASLPDIARQLTSKLVRNCPVQLPMPTPTMIMELLEDATSGSLEPMDGIRFAFNKSPVP